MHPTQHDFLLGGFIVIFLSVSFFGLALRSHFGSITAARYWVNKNSREGKFPASLREELTKASTYNLTEILVSLWGLVLGVTFCFGSLFYKGFLQFYGPVLTIGLGGMGVFIGLAEMIKKENYGLFKLRGMAAMMEGGFFLLAGFGLCLVGVLLWIKN